MEYRDEIVSILQSHIRFADHQQSTQKNIAAYCPFHKSGKESKPSFYVYCGPPTNNKFPGASFCHTCNEGWSLTGLLKKLAVPNSLIDTVKTHIESAFPQKKTLSPKFSWKVLPEATLGMFSYLPKSLLESGFNEDIIREYEIGFDRTRKRVIYPIRNHLGDLVALSGRSVTGGWPRYKIYKKELADVVADYSFDKKSVLWGLEKFYETRMYTNTDIDMPVVVCEGFKAALWVVQSGYPYTVALIGSYLSREQEALLSRIANSVVLFLDNDAAGRKATHRITSEQLAGVETCVANYRDHNDKSPDDLTMQQVHAAIETALTPINWRRSFYYE